MAAEDEVDEEQGGTADDGAVGEVEVRPHVIAEVEVEEVGDASEEDAVVEVADGAAEDEGEGKASPGERPSGVPEQVADDEHGYGGESDEQGDADALRPLGKEAEGGAGVFDVSDGEEIRNYGDVSEVQWDVADDVELGEAVEKDHDRRHEQIGEAQSGARH